MKSVEMRDVLQYPVQSVGAVAVDWVNGNLYWGDKTNRFIEVVDLNHGLALPISRDRRRILFSRGMADIYSLVIDPWEQYLFWLQIGADMVLERARLDGSDRRVIHRFAQDKSSSLAIDRHTKMLFWWGMDGAIHRVDYQGQTGCSMQLQGEWKYWLPSFLTYADGKLLFINEDRLWVTSFTCGVGISVPLDIDHCNTPTAIVASKHQLTVVTDMSTIASGSPCANKLCASLCLPTSDTTQYRCHCMTGINPPTNQSRCPPFPVRSLIVASSPYIYHISLDSPPQHHMDPIFDQAGIPLRLVYDALAATLLYLDYNSSAIYSLPLNVYNTPRRLKLDFPIFSQIPASFAIDTVSRNIYWMNHRSSEVWVARMSSGNRLQYAALLLSWLPNPLFRDGASLNRQSHPPGELAIDSFNRYLFVIVIGNEVNAIERYWLDGSHKFTVIKSPNIILPRGLALDDKGQQLFFIDAARDEMISIDYQGNNVRIIARKFPDFFGLAYIDDFIYWTDIETLYVNSIKSDGSQRSQVATIHYLGVPTMPIIVVSRNESYHTNAPCRNWENKCDQLCFPTRINHDSYSCGCSNPAHILLNMSHCNDICTMIVYYNSSAVVIHTLAPFVTRHVNLLGQEGMRVHTASVQVDYLRNHIYSINEVTNCVMKTSTGGSSSDVKSEWQILCLFSDRISSIALDIMRNNLYVAISSVVWPRIIVVRLPFPNSDVSWRKLVVSAQSKNRIIGSVAVHSTLKYIFWFECGVDHRYNQVALYQAYLDGSMPKVIWNGRADMHELTVGDSENHLYWKNNENDKFYRYHIITKGIEIFHIHWNILAKVTIRQPDWLHIYPVEKSLYLFMHDSIFHLDSTDSRVLITRNRLRLVLRVGNLVKGFSLVSKKISDASLKVALAKTDDSAGSIILCPTTKNADYEQCSQFCLPTPQRECGCGSIYSLSSDGSTCTDPNDYFMVMTNTGEIIGLQVKVDVDKKEEFQMTEWIEVPEQQLNPGQKYVDAVYWLSRDIVLRLDNHGYLSAIDQMRSFTKIKIYKQLSVQEENGNSTKHFSTYEKIYKHFLEKDVTFKDRYDGPRFSLAIDPISDVLIWSDWVNGIIAAERLNADRDRIEFIGVILDFRHSSRRPLQIAIAPISSSLIWLSADLALSGTNDSSIWRQFWIEVSDLDGSRRSVLVRDPGVPTCLTVDMHSGRVYWVDTRTDKLMSLHVHWDSYQIRVGHVFGQNMRVTVNSLSHDQVGISTSTMVVLKDYLFFTDWSRRVVGRASLNADQLKPLAGTASSHKFTTYKLRYLKHKLKGVVRMMARVAKENFKSSTLGTLLQIHPCSYATQVLQNIRCSHLCLSTLPISLAEDYSFQMTAQQLSGKFRCSCPLSMAVMPQYKVGVCVRSQYMKCDKHQFLCRAGQVFTKREGMSAVSCMAAHQQCNRVEDCLDGSDESGCNICNATHSYSCSGSNLCLPTSKRCDGVVDCESDEKCCGSQRFECLSGMDNVRCLTITDRCNGIRDCADGSDEDKCQLSEIGHKGDRSSSDDHFVMGNLSNNHTVAIIAGTVAISACSIAIIYICLSRRFRRKTVHESCLFRANNVNIMFMSPSQRPSRQRRRNTPYQRPGSSEDNFFHAKSCDIIDNIKHYDETDPASQSLTSLSDCYRRIKNPQSYPPSALGRPLFSMHDNILFQLSQLQRQKKYCVSDASVEKPVKPPPSVVSVNSEEGDKPDENIGNHNEMLSQNSLASSLCESELEEIYVHRYQLIRWPSLMDNYPSCLLQSLLSACNQTSQLRNSPATVSRDYVVENIYRRRKRKLFKYRSARRRSSKHNLSLSPSKTARMNYSQNNNNNCELFVDSSSNLQISPPPPSPITVVSA